MMKMLAGMPYMMRKPMMKGRINQLLSLSEEQRQESIRDMIEAFHSSKVNSKARESLVATRVKIVGELSADNRRTIISSVARFFTTIVGFVEARRMVMIEGNQSVAEAVSSPEPEMGLMVDGFTPWVRK